MSEAKAGPAAMGRAELIEHLLDDLPVELAVAARQAFRTATTEELRELANCVVGAEHGEDVDARAEQLGARSGERAREGEQR